MLSGKFILKLEPLSLAVSAPFGERDNEAASLAGPMSKLSLDQSAQRCQ